MWLGRTFLVISRAHGVMQNRSTCSFKNVQDKTIHTLKKRDHLQRAGRARFGVRDIRELP